MIRQIGFELYKMSRRPRTYLGFAAFLAINFFVMIGLKYGHLEGMGTHQAMNTGYGIVGSPANAEFMAWLVVGSPLSGMILIMFMPFFICLVFGEIVSGEVAEGTLRTVLCRPIRRTSFFAAKVAASMIYGVSLVLFLGISAYLLGWAFFGRGGLLVGGTFEHPMVAWYARGPALARLGLAYMLMCAGAVTVGMIAFVISNWLHNSLGAIGGAIMLLFTALIVGEIPYFRPIKDYLFSTHLLMGQKAFMDPIPWHEITYAVKCLAVYIVALFAVSLAMFRRKDVLA
jgi:ABC-2 type transport system permease protein